MMREAMNARFNGGIANGKVLFVIDFPVVLINVYRPIPITLNKEWAWYYAVYLRMGRNYSFVGYHDKKGVDNLLLEAGLDYSYIYELNP